MHEVWSCQVGVIDAPLPKAETKIYLHAIFYDFESYGDNGQRKNPTSMLPIENVHAPISVSIGDTLERKPTHICERDPAVFVHRFMEELERRGKNIRDKVSEEFSPKDLCLLPRQQKTNSQDWYNQVPVVGFNSGDYDMNLIKTHFAEELADTTQNVRVAKKGNKTIFIVTDGFRFPDIMNYLGPGTSYDKWIKAYGCKAQKSWFPYEWFD